MDAVQTGKPPESQTHVAFETAAEHATPRVPVAGPFQRVGDVREHLIGQRYESASHIVVCEADTFLGVGSDPAFGSGPLATVIQDLFSIWIYLSVTTFVTS